MKVKRKTIGFFIDTINSPYEYILYNGVNSAARKLGMNLVTFLGDMIEKPGECLKNKVYYLANKNMLDGIIFSTGTLSYTEGAETASDFVKKFTFLPCVSISQAIEGVHSLLIDNKAGLRELMRHLVKDHGFRKIAFIKGPEGNHDAEERFQAYCEILEEMKIPFDPKLVAPGDFHAISSEPALELIIKKNKMKPDAIAAANDGMAATAIHVLASWGYKPPEEIGITGFDDLENSAYDYPALSTVRQPVFELGENSVNIMHSLINKESIPEITIVPTRAVIRESCGCSNYQSRYYTVNVNQKDEGTLSGLLRTMAEIFVPHNVEPPVKLLETFISCFFNALEKNSPTLLHAVLHKDVYNYIYNAPKVHVWMDIISCLREFVIEKYKTDPSVLVEALNLIDLGRQAVDEIEYKAIMIQINNSRSRLMSYKPLAVEPVSIPDVNALLNLISQDLADTTIKGFYLVLCDDYEISDISSSKSKLLFTYDQITHPGGFTSQIIFPTGDVLPDAVLPKDRPYSFLIEPLFREKKQYGFAISEFEIDEEPYLLFVYRMLLISSFRVILNIDELKKQAVELENTNRVLRDTLSILKKTKQELIQTEEISLRDELTGLYNRRGLFLLGEKCFETAENNGEALQIFYADMDGLKKINDSYGHDEGDKAIQTIAQILIKSFRAGDIIGRVGGDEFVVIAPNSQESDYKVIKKRIMTEIKAFNVNSKKQYVLSLSIGNSSLKHNVTKNLETLIRQADVKMYGEKTIKKSYYE
ncbi:MAG: GGDEF domain-containing protein [Spirochaetales bacterium]|nr:GGDEF domain-containing protein [Spirochaetales bacterium]